MNHSYDGSFPGWRRIAGGLRLAIFASLFGALAVACGGGGDDSNSDTSSSFGDEEDRAIRLSSQLGPDDAFDAVVFAFERGYSVDQVVAAIDAGSLDSKGSIEGIGPEGSPLGLVILPDSARIAAGTPMLISFDRSRPRAESAFAGLGEPTAIDVATLRAKATEEAEYVRSTGHVNIDRELAAGTWALILILKYAEAGYTAEQITEVLYLGAIEDETSFTRYIEGNIRDERDCLVLRDETGQVMVPGGDPREPGCLGRIESLAKEEAEAANAQRSGGEASAQASEDCPGYSDEICAHSGTHHYTQAANLDVCPIAAAISEGDYTLTFEPGKLTAHSEDFGWTLELEQTAPETFENDSLVWTFDGPVITRTAKTNCIVYVMTRVD